MQTNYMQSVPFFNEDILPGVHLSGKCHYQLSPEKLISHALERKEGVLSDTGALIINTAEFTGRSPKDRFIVKDAITAQTVDWNDGNQPLEEKYFQRIYQRMTAYLDGKELWVRDCYVCAKEDYRLGIRIINENSCCSLFACNMFLRPAQDDKTAITWHLIQTPRFLAMPAAEGVPNVNFVIINFSKKCILIGGTQYTGEIKKAVFSVLNFLLPKEQNVLSMHCAANRGKKGDTALFFGLSGTGKTTLSADNSRQLIGDDEHGWDDTSVFNFEGGCYAKIIDLDKAKEPEIYQAIRFGTIVENVTCFTGTNIIDYASKEITENTRASYPLGYIANAAHNNSSNIPNNIFFLTADAFGVLPPVSRLSENQAIYHFLSGYTAKVAGTENGVATPKPTFSACFGAPFLPLSPIHYAEMLCRKIKDHQVKVWLINTGWTGGGYGKGSRIPLEYTRSIVKAVLQGDLETVAFTEDGAFGLMVPIACPGVPAELLHPVNTWNNKMDYYATAYKLACYFEKNFEKYRDAVSAVVASAGPKMENKAC